MPRFSAEPLTDESLLYDRSGPVGDSLLRVWVICSAV